MKRVLIIDDNQMLANLYRSALEAGGLAVEIAADGEAGLSKQIVETVRTTLGK